MSCKHTYLQLVPSPFAELAGFEQPDEQARTAAETKAGIHRQDAMSNSKTTLPGPLVLPHDELNYDPDCVPQDFKEWLSIKERNKMTVKRRNTLYVAHVPQVNKEVDFMRDWTSPHLDKASITQLPSPDTDLFVDYLSAFYHGMEVRVLPNQLSWTSWDKSSRPSRQASIPKYVGLANGTKSTTRIRVRAAPDKTFAAQLNLDDILDTAISILPSDAYAILLLVDHDIYEDEDDDFCCGRAYGGSRVAVVQTARYNPLLDVREGIDREHMWPTSHCKAFVDRLCAVEDVVAKPPTKEQKRWSREGAMRAAVKAASSRTEGDYTVKELQNMWFARLAKTVSHELGHCFGIAHCSNYACNMQGTAGMKEDVRQPPYLCPVCEAKVAHAIVKELRNDQEETGSMWVQQRGTALEDFCQRLEDEGLGAAMWSGLKAWLMKREV